MYRVPSSAILICASFQGSLGNCSIDRKPADHAWGKHRFPVRLAPFRSRAEAPHCKAR